MAEVEKLSLYKLKEYKWRWKIMEHSTSKSHFMDIYWLITKAKCTSLVESLHGDYGEQGFTSTHSSSS